MVDESLTIALVGAGGAVLGSVISSVPSYVLERLRNRREEQAEHARGRESLREAGRLVAEELREAERLIERSAQTGRYWPGVRDLPTDTWNRYRHALAIHLGSADWASVTVAYDAVNRLNWTVNERRGRVMTVESREQGERVADGDDLHGCWRAVVAALYVLDSEVGIPMEVGQHLQRLLRREVELWGGRESGPAGSAIS